MRTAICDEHQMPRTERSRHHWRFLGPKTLSEELGHSGQWCLRHRRHSITQTWVTPKNRDFGWTLLKKDRLIPWNVIWDCKVQLRKYYEQSWIDVLNQECSERGSISSTREERPTESYWPTDQLIGRISSSSHAFPTGFRECRSSRTWTPRWFIWAALLWAAWQDFKGGLTVRRAGCIKRLQWLWTICICNLHSHWFFSIAMEHPALPITKLDLQMVDFPSLSSNYKLDPKGIFKVSLGIELLLILSSIFQIERYPKHD